MRDLWIWRASAWRETDASPWCRWCAECILTCLKRSPGITHAYWHNLRKPRFSREIQSISAQCTRDFKSTVNYLFSQEKVHHIISRISHWFLPFCMCLQLLECRSPGKCHEWISKPGWFCPLLRPRKPPLGNRCFAQAFSVSSKKDKQNQKIKTVLAEAPLLAIRLFQEQG